MGDPRVREGGEPVWFALPAHHTSSGMSIRVLARIASLRALLSLAWGAGGLAAQSGAAPGSADSVTVVAGAAYGGGGLKRALLGDEYRDLWTVPIRVAVLDLGRFAGGLEVLESGGRKQTLSLRFRGADGRQYVFRSVDKAPILAETPDLEGTFAGWLLRDQTSALFPGAAVALPPLMDAAGVLHAGPRLVVMPGDPRLGEHRAEFAGLLGTIEERPDHEEGAAPPLGGAVPGRVIGSERLRERLLEGPEDRVDARALLAARLLDALVNDRDRHWDQWRWGEFESGGTRWWRPIPEDRDHALVHFNGVLPSLAGRVAPHLLSFGSGFAAPAALSHNAFDMDRRLLAELPRETWDSVAAALRARLTDPVIAGALDRLPTPYRDLAAPRVERVLRARREALPAFASAWYGWISSEVDVHGTDAAELARADRLADGSVEVSLRPLADGVPAGEPFFRRRFVPGETGEVRIYLHGGDDRAVVTGRPGPGGIVVRVVGGEGDDVFADSSRGGHVAFYDDAGAVGRVDGGGLPDPRPFTPPEEEDALSGARYRDFGSAGGFAPLVDYGGTLGLVLGAGRTWTRYGFRQVPYAWKATVRGAYSFRLNAAGVEVEADRRRPNSCRGASLLLRATQLEPFHLYGLGNDTHAGAERQAYLVERDLVLVAPALDLHLGYGRLSAGPVLVYSRLRPRAESRAAGVRGEGVAQLGARAEAGLDLRDTAALPRRGFAASLGGAAYGTGAEDDGAFGEVHAAVSTYLSVPGRRGPTLALRAGGKRVWGGFPPHEAAFLGGWSTLRGHHDQRFAGDAALWGTAEVRTFLARANLGVRGDLGALVFGDAGRVYLDGASPGGWHTAAGGGLYFLFHFQEAPVSASLSYARGETGKLRVQLGVPF
jgi:hypothetical protein